MDDRIATPQEAAQAAERAEQKSESINTQDSEPGYYTPLKGCSNR